MVKYEYIHELFKDWVYLEINFNNSGSNEIPFGNEVSKNYCNENKPLHK